MSDKLLVEIDLHNGETEDAVRALVYLANELVEASTIEINSPIKWNERTSMHYQVKWRFSEDELQLPLEIDFVSDLRDELNNINISENGESALESFKRQLDHYISHFRPSLLEAD